MSKMIVRPPQFWANPWGNPAEDYDVYVGLPNQEPTQEQYQLDITDGVGGPIVSNPFKITKGLAKNANGQIITPVINQQEYSLFFSSPSGGGIKIAKFIGDGLSSNGGSGGGIPDLTINNLDQALQTDLSAYNFVFIKSESSGWEGSANGPSIVSFYYRDGTTGAASSGDENKFFDLSGNGWSLAKTVAEKKLEDSILGATFSASTYTAGTANTDNKQKVILNSFIEADGDTSSKTASVDIRGSSAYSVKIKTQCFRDGTTGSAQSIIRHTVLSGNAGTYTGLASSRSESGNTLNNITTYGIRERSTSNTNITTTLIFNGISASTVSGLSEYEGTLLCSSPSDEIRIEAEIDPSNGATIDGYYWIIEINRLDNLS